MIAHRTPWRVIETTRYTENMGENRPVQIVDADDNAVALCGWPGAPTNRDVGNAQAIVDAINKLAAPTTSGFVKTARVTARPYCTFCGGDFGKHEASCAKATGSAS
jgi:hypothetical protein